MALSENRASKNPWCLIFSFPMNKTATKAEAWQSLQNQSIVLTSIPGQNPSKNMLGSHFA